MAAYKRKRKVGIATILTRYVPSHLPQITCNLSKIPLNRLIEMSDISIVLCHFRISLRNPRTTEYK